MSSMHSGLEPVIALYQTHLDTCREMANIILSGTERIERASMKALRDGVHRSLDAASAMSKGEPSAELPAPPKLEALLATYREMADAVFKTNSELARALTDYCTSCSKSVTDSVHEAGHTSSAAATAAGQMESIAKLWNQAYQRMGEFAQSVAKATESGYEVAGARTHKRAN